MKSTFVSLSVVAIAAILMTQAAASAIRNEDFKLLPPQGGDLSAAIALRDDVALVGAVIDYGAAVDSGAAYVYRRDPATGGWALETKLLASDGQTDDEFGNAVALCGEVAVIGANGDGDNGAYSGSAYVFRHDSSTGLWIEEAKLTASDGAYGDRFGCSVSVAGDYIAIGACLDDDHGSDSGSVYMFEFDPSTGTWSQAAKLARNAPYAHDGFGFAVASWGDEVLVSVPAIYLGAIGKSHALMYRRDPATGDWNKVNSLVSTGDDPHGFGQSLSLRDGLAVVGSPWELVDNVGSGAVYVFRFFGHATTIVQLTPNDAQDNMDFGDAVSLDGDAILVGSPDDDFNGWRSGSAYLFRYDPLAKKWYEAAKLIPSDGETNDYCGAGSALWEETALVTVPGDDDMGNHSGSVCGFEVAHGDPVFDIKLNGGDGPVTVPSTQAVTMTVSITPNAQAGMPRDCWILARRNGAAFYSRLPGGWTSGIARFYAGPLPAVNGRVIHSGPVPPGSYVFGIAADQRDNVLQGSCRDLIRVTSL